ncbi:MAG: tRNA 2-thiouridine(34) synthase MnmA [Synergistaceae bacterium]|nr:tRNA 2-thiouridine(34) synthase MnmA [Synergistaceae bacterium]
MSGGVDSSVAAYLLKSQGYDCVGATMRLFLNGDVGIEPDRPCCSQKDAEDAAAVARTLGFPHEVLDRMVDFKLKVIDKFIASYGTGQTPNPCIDCNRYLKFGSLLDAARKRGLDFVATGHYARIGHDEKTGRRLLKKGADPARDQSYVLYTLTQEQLARMLFPLGDRTKAEVRDLAASQGFRNAHKRDSQDICFVPDGDYASFIERYTGDNYPPGDFIDAAGRVLGRHRGIIHYTLGQRRGLGVAADSRLYVSGIDATSNRITLSPEKPLCRVVIAEEINLIAVPFIERPLRVKAKVRYHQTEIPATVTQTDADKLMITFDALQPAPARGQAAVLYDGDTVVGGGTVAEVE